MSKQGLTIAQAAKALGLSPKTIRRHIKEGRISATLTHGKYGHEYRILELPQQKTKEKPLDTPMDTTSTLALDIITGLQQENRNLAGHLGVAQERIRTLENQVKLLTVGKLPWWQRILRRRA